MSGRSHRFLGITSTFWDVNVSCSRIQHGDLNDRDVNDIHPVHDAYKLVYYWNRKTSFAVCHNDSDVIYNISPNVKRVQNSCHSRVNNVD